MSSEPTLRQSIINTLAYFDLADFPLTREELFSWLWLPPASLNYPEFLAALDKLKLDYKFGYYFLPGQEKIMEERRQKFLISAQKLKMARLAIRVIKSIPYLRAVFICNTVASEQADENSDIDFFIITAAKRIWIVRFFTNLILRLCGLRTYGKKNKNKICLSFYVTVESLNLVNLRIADDDIHLAYWLNQMLPIFDPDNLYAKFLQENSWTKYYLPNLAADKNASYLPKISESFLDKLWKKAWEKMWQGKYGDLINNQVKKIQLLKMKFSGKPADHGIDKGVVISDQVLKFHEKDTRIPYRQAWQQKIYELEKNI
ncbi:MAG TPA: hypothetical protein VLK22_04375 [Candidatus Udaeobacter sp.]|nr:hypothetical protein [Candidatus Udaeobacter sp.]